MFRSVKVYQLLIPEVFQCQKMRHVCRRDAVKKILNPESSSERGTLQTCCTMFYSMWTILQTRRSKSPKGMFMFIIMTIVLPSVQVIVNNLIYLNKHLKKKQMIELVLCVLCCKAYNLLENC